MTISYTTGIPAASHNPSTDQPNMKTNNDNIKTIIAVDHATFDTSNSGTHNHVTFTSAQSDPSLTASQNQIYPKTFGTATTYLETYSAFRASAGNQIIGYSPMVKCMGQFTTINGGGAIAKIADTLYVNVATIVQAAAAVTITFTTALPYATYAVFVTKLTSGSPTLGTITRATGTVIIGLSDNVSVGTFCFMVI